MSITHYDIIIIGSGIAGLYSAYNIKKKSPNTSYLILEKNNKQSIGGRINSTSFYGTSVLSGAGIGRNDTNPLLKKLMKELNISFQKSTSIIDYSNLLQESDKYDVVKIIEILKKEYNKNTKKYEKMTFKEFGISVLGEANYKMFTLYCGYTDYENADVYETLYNYGMDDTKGGWGILYIPWKQLIDKLCQYIGHENIKTSNEVSEIITREHDDIKRHDAKSDDVKRHDVKNMFEIKTNNGEHTYYCNKVIVATTITSIMKLIDGASNKDSPYKQIHGQQFLRLYAKFDKQSNELLKNTVKHYTIVPGPLQKIIPMDTEKGVYMIAYSDNKSASILKNKLENNANKKAYFETLVEKSLGLPNDSMKIVAIKYFYFVDGTHYFEPLHGFNTRKEFLHEVQHPSPGILVVGEAVSTYQGWVEGALESVESVVNKKWIL
jgi:hypothetical protein